MGGELGDDIVLRLAPGEAPMLTLTEGSLARVTIPRGKTSPKEYLFANAARREAQEHRRPLRRSSGPCGGPFAG